MVHFSSEINLNRSTLKKLIDALTRQQSNEFISKENLEKILVQDDIYLAAYLLNLFKDKIEYVDDLILTLIHKLLRSFDSIPNTLNKLVLNILQTKLRDVTLPVFMNTACLLQIDKKHCDFIVDYFGYSQIYKYSKHVLQTMLKQDYTVNQIGYSLFLLNHPKLCYKNLLPLFKKISQFADPQNKSVLDRNIIKICKGIQAVIIFAPETFNQKNNLLLSILVFLNKTMFLEEFYDFVGLKDLTLFLETVYNIVAVISLDTTTKNVLKGIYNKSVQHLDYLIKKESYTYEDFMVFYSVTYQINILFWFIQLKNEEKDTLLNLGQMFETKKFLKPVYIEDSMHEEVITLVLNEKYIFLQNISLVTAFKIDTNYLIQELEQINNAHKILVNIKTDLLDIKQIISIACKKENQLNFSDLILASDDCDQKIKFIESIIQEENLIVQLYMVTILHREFIRIAEHSKFFELLIEIFIQNIDDNDLRFFEIKIRILKLLNECKNDIADTFLEDISKYKETKNLKVLILYVVLLKENITSKCIVNYITAFVKNIDIENINLSVHTKDITDEKAKTEDNILFKKHLEKNEFDKVSAKMFLKNIKDVNNLKVDFENLTVSSFVWEQSDNTNYLGISNINQFYNIDVHILGLMFSKCKHDEIIEQLHFHGLYKVKLLSYCFKEEIDCNFSKLEHELLIFMFKATEQQKNEIEVLYNYILNNYKDKDSSVYISINTKLKNLLKNN